MSACIKKVLQIDVTNGDCVKENKKSGKSNTGTYFISSSSNYDEFGSYFNLNNIYKIDLTKVEIYRTLFTKFFLKYKDEYIGKMESFDLYCNKLLSLEENPEIDVATRCNDSRIFMKFVDNQNEIINSFRSILYEDLSIIEIKRIDKNIYYMYPIINENTLKENANDFLNFIYEEQEG